MILIVSRHPGALAWLHQQGIEADQYHRHLDSHDIAPGDTVIGTLPIDLAAEVTARGADYWHISLNLPEEWRGQELTAALMERYGARLKRFVIYRRLDRL